MELLDRVTEEFLDPYTRTVVVYTTEKPNIASAMEDGVARFGDLTFKYTTRKFKQDEELSTPFNAHCINLVVTTRGDIKHAPKVRVFPTGTIHSVGVRSVEEGIRIARAIVYIAGIDDRRVEYTCVPVMCNARVREPVPACDPYEFLSFANTHAEKYGNLFCVMKDGRNTIKFPTGNTPRTAFRGKWDPSLGSVRFERTHALPKQCKSSSIKPRYVNFMLFNDHVRVSTDLLCTAAPFLAHLRAAIRDCIDNYNKVPEPSLKQLLSPVLRQTKLVMQAEYNGSSSRGPASSPSTGKQYAL